MWKWRVYGPIFQGASAKSSPSWFILRISHTSYNIIHQHQPCILEVTNFMTSTAQPPQRHVTCEALRSTQAAAVEACAVGWEQKGRLFPWDLLDDSCKFASLFDIYPSSSIVITPHQFSEFKHASKSCLGPPDTLAKRDLTSHKNIAKSSKGYQKTCNSQHDYLTPPMPFHSLLAPSSSAVPLLKPLVAASFFWRFVVGFNGVTRQGLSSSSSSQLDPPPSLLCWIPVFLDCLPSFKQFNPMCTLQQSQP